jgi:hypothetical protein
MQVLKFEKLSKRHAEAAVDYFTDVLIKHISEGVLRFNDQLNGDDLQLRIDTALQKAETNQTPWFSADFLRDDAVIVESVRGMAQCDAEDAFYEVVGAELRLVESKPIASGLKG